MGLANINDAVVSNLELNGEGNAMKKYSGCQGLYKSSREQSGIFSRKTSCVTVEDPRHMAMLSCYNRTRTEV
jgi:hypothetical protein